jgi:hypothetical protein
MSAARILPMQPQPQPKPGPPPACQRLRHEWARDHDRGVGFRCRCCPAVGVVCPGCDGRRDVDSPSSFARIPCGRCGAVGILEVVEITAAEVAVLVRDQDRLRIADELWSMQGHGESLISIVDAINATVMSGLRAAHGARERDELEDTGIFPGPLVTPADLAAIDDAT